MMRLLLTTLTCALILGTVHAGKRKKYVLAIQERGKESRILMHGNNESTIGDVRKFIEDYTRATPGKICIGSKILHDNVLLMNEHIFDNPDTLILFDKYDLSNTAFLDGRIAFIKQTGIEQCINISVKIDIGVTTQFTDLVYEINHFLSTKPWFDKKSMNLDRVPILFVLQNCRNDISSVRDYPHGCFAVTLELLKKESDHLDAADCKFSDLLTTRKKVIQKYNQDDIAMLRELFEMELTARDSLIWIRTQPQKPSKQFMQKYNFASYYCQNFYVYMVDIAKHGDYVLALHNQDNDHMHGVTVKNVKMNAKALRYMERKQARGVRGPMKLKYDSGANKLYCCSIL